MILGDNATTSSGLRQILLICLVTLHVRRPGPPPAAAPACRRATPPGTSPPHLLLLQALLYLFTVWSVDVRCLVRYARCRGLAGAHLVKVVPHAFAGSRDVVPLERRLVEERPQVGFSFRKLRFVWAEERGAFAKLEYPSKVSAADARGAPSHSRNDSGWCR